MSDLSKYLPYEGLRHEFILSLLLLYQLSKVSLLAVLHDNVDFHLFFVNDSVIVPHDVGVSKFPQNIDFRDELLFFFFRHFPVVEFFPN